jgi:glycosyltransferase involved in cell wall biosynthesis
MEHNATEDNSLLYFGPFYTASVVKERGLPTRNIAAYNRMYRFAKALESSGVFVQIVSCGISMRARWKGNLLHKQHMEEVDGTKVTTLAMLGIPFLGFLFEPFFLSIWVVNYFRSRNRNVSHVLLYNFSPSYVLLAFILKLFRVPFFSQIEDISVPEFDDWRTESHTRPVQQIIFYFCMHTITYLSEGIIVPSERFCNKFPASMPQLIITGCINANISASSLPDFNERPLRILFAGKYENEHGLDVLIETARLLQHRSDASSMLEFHCCGAGNYPELLVELSDYAKYPKVILHGILDDHEYVELLKRTHIALALQKSKGRYAQYKTPSKAYEFLGFGKLVVTYDIGDFRRLMDNQLIVLEKETAEELYALLIDCLENTPRYEGIAQEGLKYAKIEYPFSAVGNRLRNFIEMTSV